MKFSIEGKEYDVIRSLSKPSLNIVMELLEKTGMGMKTLAARANKLQGVPAIDILDDAEHLQTMRVLIWLARRVEGETLTVEEANNFPLDGILLVKEDAPEADEEPDPKALTGSVQAAKRPAKTGTSRTSRPRSTKTS